MILPTKHISLQTSLLGAGAAILRQLNSPHTATALWEQVRKSPEITVYGRFILALDFLFTIGAINLSNGLITRAQYD